MRRGKRRPAEESAKTRTTAPCTNVIIRLVSWFEDHVAVAVQPFDRSKGWR